MAVFADQCLPPLWGALEGPMKEAAVLGGLDAFFCIRQVPALDAKLCNEFIFSYDEERRTGTVLGSEIRFTAAAISALMQLPTDSAPLQQSDRSSEMEVLYRMFVERLLVRSNVSRSLVEEFLIDSSPASWATRIAELLHSGAIASRNGSPFHLGRWLTGLIQTALGIPLVWEPPLQEEGLSSAGAANNTANSDCNRGRSCNKPAATDDSFGESLSCETSDTIVDGNGDMDLAEVLVKRIEDYKQTFSKITSRLSAEKTKLKAAISRNADQLVTMNREIEKTRQALYNLKVKRSSMVCGDMHARTLNDIRISAAEKRLALASTKAKAHTLERKIEANELLIRKAKDATIQRREAVNKLNKEHEKFNEAVQLERQLQQEHERELKEHTESCPFGSYHVLCARSCSTSVDLKEAKSDYSAKMKKLEKEATRSKANIAFMKSTAGDLSLLMKKKAEKASSIQELYNKLNRWVLLDADRVKNVKPRCKVGEWDPIEFTQLWDAYSYDRGVQNLLAEMFIRGDIRFNKLFNPNSIFGDVDLRAQLWYRDALRRFEGDGSAAVPARPVACDNFLSSAATGTDEDEFWSERMKVTMSELWELYSEVVKANFAQSQYELVTQRRVREALEAFSCVAFDEQYVKTMKENRQCCSA